MSDADLTRATTDDTTTHSPRGATERKRNEEDRAPMGMTIRVFIYLVAVHFIVAFFFLIFWLAGAE
ncbi:DUF6126 family protein [Streptomyces netropsis]|uniref:Small hydrophobic protein n=1 Tax=Streptomyces netropsis TaxID=55404 RepID=A0A7W7LF11_STRNE|nr:DUF6126 family protein [Streptomyces netropsis]MBB4888446.1 hypothetical protein [Streptomyces netropsis]GGR29241.1 hypothetical protein GCM10010219_37510 [Streptomyces netropsis]